MGKRKKYDYNQDVNFRQCIAQNIWDESYMSTKKIDNGCEVQLLVNIFK